MMLLLTFVFVPHPKKRDWTVLSIYLISLSSAYMFLLAVGLSRAKDAVLLHGFFQLLCCLQDLLRVTFSIGWSPILTLCCLCKGCGKTSLNKVADLQTLDDAPLKHPLHLYGIWVPLTLFLRHAARVCYTRHIFELTKYAATRQYLR
ncbi:hypothetical protein DL96DRAFT_682787 [Flagelloscypha sp. PMI_526]|nr:hypothetical protein DL96DRAFT_682787 [Flagelloscypha sp. PMI_526]